MECYVGASPNMSYNPSIKREVLKHAPYVKRYAHFMESFGD